MNTNGQNRNKHEEGQSRKQRDKNGEKGDTRRTPNPNKRKPQNFEVLSIGERILCGAIVIVGTAAIIYFVANDATIVGVLDDAAVVPTAAIVWDNLSKVFA